MSKSIAHEDISSKQNLLGEGRLRMIVRALNSLGGTFREIANAVEGEIPDRVSGAAS